MAYATRVGDLNTGHDLCPPTTLIQGSSNVFINNKGAGRLGDKYGAHSCEDHSSHNDYIKSGSSTVYINGKPAARIGDSVLLGGKVATGSNNVEIGG